MASNYLATPGNGAGGSLHVVLDDANVADSDVRFCLACASKSGDWRGVLLAAAILALSKSQRHRLVRRISEKGRAWLL